MRRIMLSCFVLALAASTLTPNVAQASPISLAEWSLAGKLGTEASDPATFTASGITADNLVRGPGLTGFAGANSMNSASWSVPLAADDFVSLGFHVTGSPVLVQDFFLGTRSSATGPGFINVDISIDGGPFTTFTTLTQPSATFINPHLVLNQVVHSSLAVEFRAANTTAANGGTIGTAGTWRITDFFQGGVDTHPVEFVGTVLPEPASMTLAVVGLAGFGVTVWRRRRSA